MDREGISDCRHTPDRIEESRQVGLRSHAELLPCEAVNRFVGSAVRL